jgi:hypothetical protein
VEIKKVWQRKDGVKFVIIPKESNINHGDYVKIIKLGGQNVKRTTGSREES